MKKRFSQIVEFIKAHNTAFLAAVITVGVVAAAAVAGFTVFKPVPDPPQTGNETLSIQTASDTVSEIDSVDVASSEESTNEAENENTSSEPEESASVSSSDVTSKKETSKDTESKKTTSKDTSSKKTSSKNTSSKSNSSAKKVVQRADPDEGISWDGKSPIVYTYPDGTTGTEKKEGATYEQVPGVIDVVEEIEYVEYDGKCSDCGKVEGDGTKGTCVQWLMGAVDCPNCGKHVKPHVCHTCNQ